MEFRQFSNACLVRFDRGEKLPEALASLALQQGWKSGAVSAIGAVDNLTLGYFDLKQKKYLKFDIEGISELLSLKGNLSYLQGKPFWHLHAVVGDRHGNVRGGHVVKMDVAITLECWIFPQDILIERVPDSFTGLNLLNLK